MSIQFVGYASNTANPAPSLVDLTSLTGGIGSAAVAGDIVIGIVGYGTATQEVGWTTANEDSDPYTTIVNALFANHTFGNNHATLDIAWWLMPDPPHTDISYHGTENELNSQAAIALVFRGVDQTTPIDVTTTTASQIGSGQPDSPSITPTTSGAWIIAAGVSANDNVATKTGPSNMSNFVQIADVGTVNDCIVGFDYKDDWSSGAFDPAAWTGGSDVAADSWCAATIALRPAATASADSLPLTICINT